MEESDTESFADDPISLVINDSQSSAVDSNAPATNSLENQSTETVQITSSTLEVGAAARKRKTSVELTSTDSQDCKNLKLVKCDGDDSDSNYQWRMANFNKKKVNIYTEDTGSKWYNIGSPLVTQSIVSTRLEEAFEGLPIYGAPLKPAELKEFQDKTLKDFMGSALTDEEFEKVSTYCRCVTNIFLPFGSKGDVSCPVTYF